jgi:hypothetical protein
MERAFGSFSEQSHSKPILTMISRPTNTSRSTTVGVGFVIQQKLRKEGVITRYEHSYRYGDDQGTFQQPLPIFHCGLDVEHVYGGVKAGAMVKSYGGPSLFHCILNYWLTSLLRSALHGVGKYFSVFS